MFNGKRRNIYTSFKMGNNIIIENNVKYAEANKRTKLNICLYNLYKCSYRNLLSCISRPILCPSGSFVTFKCFMLCKDCLDSWRQALNYKSRCLMLELYGEKLKIRPTTWTEISLPNEKIRVVE